MLDSNQRLQAFTLTEVLIALVIVGILIYLALPDYSKVVTDAKSMEAKMQLEHLHALQKSHFMVHSKYSSDLEELGFVQQKLVEEGGTANYRIELVSSNHGQYLARATSVTDFNQNGILNTWEIDQDKGLREVIKD